MKLDLTRAQAEALLDACIVADGEDEVTEPWTRENADRKRARDNARQKLQRAAR